MSNYKLLQLTYHTNPKYYEFVFLDNSTAAIDEYIEAMLGIVKDTRENGSLDQPIFILIDITQSGLYSLRYALTAVRDRLIPQAKDIPPIFFAYITDDSGDRMLIEQFQYMDNTRQKDSRKVFSSSEREQAVNWLLSNN